MVLVPHIRFPRLRNKINTVGFFLKIKKSSYRLVRGHTSILILILNKAFCEIYREDFKFVHASK